MSPASRRRDVRAVLVPELVARGGEPAAEPRSTLTAPALASVPTSSPRTPTARSSKPSLLKSPTARASPNGSPLSARSRSPALSWCQIWSPAAVRPAAEPYSTLTAPAFAAAPTSSPRTPIARSSKPSLSKSPTARARRRSRPLSAAPSMPATSWCQNWSPVAVSPAAEPCSTLTAPAFATVPTSSPGTPMARSSKPSLSKSPTARALPKHRRSPRRSRTRRCPGARTGRRWRSGRRPSRRAR